MKVLIVGNTAFTGENLKKGLEEHKIKVVLVKDKDIKWYKNKKIDDDFDIVHINSCNLKKLLYIKKFIYKNLIGFKPKIIIHYHGSDLRIYRKSFPCRFFIKFIGDYFLYSTMDLAWWIRDIDNNKKSLFFNPIDMDLFKPFIRFENRSDEILNFGRRFFKDYVYPHDEIPSLLNKYKFVNVQPSYNLSPYMITLSVMEAASCGCVNPLLPYMDRSWVMVNAAMNVQIPKLINIYEKVIRYRIK